VERALRLAPQAGTVGDAGVLASLTVNAQMRRLQEGVEMVLASPGRSSVDTVAPPTVAQA
jgi:hypothetical protein